ncbi:hypothetical protein FIU89_21820 (plasmid) [Roseovarius sp. THAF27]|uniref:hypothetical protein n=1 Tax=unclassified Roseovarius TaxID=2614913 RepID=UPI00126871E1|nr:MULTISPECIES: hypothetical protein [unclassified Roseovarius]QFT83275.1 hypothetical protein FIU89_21820 [Roseovarius sp. THAF27]QFT99919.1 hypothetical protein FIU85_21545 [Roseovarius sp. THAF8]
MTTPIDRIVFTGDFLRPSVGGLKPTQHENIRWLAQTLDVSIRRACGLTGTVVHWDNRWINTPRLDQNTVASIYQAFGRAPTIQSWPTVFSAETLPAAVEHLFLRYFERSLVIGFELPPYLAHFCRRHDIPFLDLSFSPIRFMDDLLLDFSASDPALNDAARAWQVPEGLIELQSGAVSAHAAKAFANPPRPNTLLVILQTRFDKVVIDGGRFVTVLDHLDRLYKIAQDYDAVLIREHPLERQEGVGQTLQRVLPHAVVTTENVYRLLGHHNLRGVAALSSSCVAEARWFGKTGHYLLPGFSPDRFTPGASTVTVGDALITADFWRDVLAATGLPVTDPDGLKLPFKTNRFRQQLRSAWGYNQIDTDIFAHWAAGR